MTIAIVRIVILLCVLVSMVSGQPAPAPTETKPADAKPPDGKSLTKFDISKVEVLFDKGTKHYDLGEWDAAIAAFKQAYALMPDPSFLFNLGQSYRQKGSCRDATAAYNSYLRNATDDDRAKVEQFIRELDACVKVEEERARRLLPPPPLPRLSPRHRTVRRVGWGVGAAGVLVLGGAAAFTARSFNAESDLEACAAQPDGCSGSDARKIDDRGNRSERYAIRLGIVGGIVAMAGLSLVVYTKVRGEYITVTPTANGASIGVRF